MRFLQWIDKVVSWGQQEVSSCSIACFSTTATPPVRWSREEESASWLSSITTHSRWRPSRWTRAGSGGPCTRWRRTLCLVSTGPRWWSELRQLPVVFDFRPKRLWRGSRWLVISSCILPVKLSLCWKQNWHLVRCTICYFIWPVLEI